jgi:hypothetical protein
MILIAPPAPSAEARLWERVFAPHALPQDSQRKGKERKGIASGVPSEDGWFVDGR